MIFPLPALLISTSKPRLDANGPEIEPAEIYRIVSKGFGPVGEVRVKRPTFAWSVVPQNEKVITDTQILINGRKVSGVYDPRRGEVRYTPERSLLPGEYTVAMNVQVDSAVTFKKEWKTVVPASAVERLPAPGRKQTDVFLVLNSLRSEMGLDLFTLDPSLCAAADSHARYLEENNAIGHVQSEGHPGFSGANPWDRTRAYGFSGGTWEAAGYEVSDPKEAVAAIFDAPYHRIPFLQPGSACLGVGMSARGTVVDGEMPLGTGTVMSPADGQRNTPRAWKGYERPDPLRLWPALQRPVGYPIVLADFAKEEETAKLVVSSARLTLAGKSVEAFLNTPANDEFLISTAILIPAEPLEAGATYTVEMRASRAGRDISRRWSFKTAND